MINPNPNFQNLRITTDYTSRLGPSNSLGTYTGIIAYQINQKIQPLINLMQNLKNVSQNAVENANNIAFQLIQPLNQLSVYQNGTQKIKSNINT